MATADIRHYGSIASDVTAFGLIEETRILREYLLGSALSIIVSIYIFAAIAVVFWQAAKSGGNRLKVSACNIEDVR